MALCGKPQIVNNTNSWTLHDEEVLNRAKTRCGEIWKDAVCLKKFVKIETGRYMAGCGK